MLFYRVDWCCNGTLLLMLAVTGCAMFAYFVDSNRAADDPKKKNYHPLAILLAPITFPILAILYISFFILRVVAYTVFMVLFILALMCIRKPFITEGLQKTATSLGDRLMEANTFIVRLFLRSWTDTNGSA